MTTANPLVCPNCAAAVSPTARECDACGRALSTIVGSTISSDLVAAPVTSARPTVPKPAADALPRWIGLADIALILATLASGFLTVRSDWAVSTPDELRRIWREEVAVQLRDPESNARIERKGELPRTGAAVFFVDDRRDAELANSFLSAMEFHAVSERVLSTSSQHEPVDAGSSFVVEIRHGWTGSSIRVLCFKNRERTAPLGRSERAMFALEESRARINAWAFVLLASVATGGLGLRRLLVLRHRGRLLVAWKDYTAERTRGIFEAKEYLDSARKSAEQNQVAKALVELRQALEKVPEYGEALELRNLLMHSDAVAAPAITGTHAAGEGGSGATTLYLRVFGTPYAYRADREAELIRIGRQREKSPGDGGNDLVIRVPASDERTRRISRRHLEIRRIGRDYFAIDRSGGRTQLNGTALDPNVPVQIDSGDRLNISRVLSLEVSIRGGAGTESAAKIIQTDHGPARFELEATVGDMLTEVADG